MTNRDNPVTVYLTDDEKAKLKRWSDKTNKSISQLARQAILEYTDRDRVERVESEMNQLHEKMDRVLSLIDSQHAHTSIPSDATKSVPQKAREIVRRLYQNHEMPVRNEDVEIAIEDIAGGDSRTLKKYKKQFKKRGLLYEHPVSPVWTDDKEQFVKWSENATVNNDVHDAIQDYGISATEYTKLAEELDL